MTSLPAAIYIWGFLFNQPIDLVVCPSPLRTLEFRVLFNQPIDQVVLSASMEHSTLGSTFDNSLDQVA